MRYEYVTRKEQRIRKLVPAIHNLVFIYSTRKGRLTKLRRKMLFFYLFAISLDRETKQPIIVPEIQMRHFIAIAGSYDQQVIYLPPTEYSMQKGDRVRITGGVFEGVEGIFVRVKGDRRVVVSIQGLWQ
ncbi:MAG: UpxY family transcription antiterminator [Bacteroides cellulosilyticus]